MNEFRPERLPGILLLGPTGSGKTPLGNWLETHGFRGHPCHHFDFGANLRAAIAAGPNTGLTDTEIDFLRGVLARGALLENETSYLALKILDGFVARRGVQPEHWLVLNGVPRHAAQAQALESRLGVRVVIRLECAADVVQERLRRDAGGDRAGRTDDCGAMVARKLAEYEERTRPLAAHYRARGAQVLSIDVGIETQLADIGARIEQAPQP
jgi:adenylate kinase